MHRNFCTCANQLLDGIFGCLNRILDSQSRPLEVEFCLGDSSKLLENPGVNCSFGAWFFSCYNGRYYMLFQELNNKSSFNVITRDENTRFRDIDIGVLVKISTV